MAQVESAEQLSLFETWGPDMAKLRRVLTRLSGRVRAESTLRAYKSDWEDFARWCSAAGRSSMPAAPDTVALYIADCLGRLKLATVERRAAAISSVHKGEGQKSPVDETVRNVISGARRERGDDREAKVAVTVEDLRKIIRKLPRTPVGVRDRALILVGFASGMRRSELSALDLADVTFTKSGVRVRIRRSKTDQVGDGRKIGLFPGKRKTTCPMLALKQWLYLRGKADGPLFWRVGTDQKLTSERLSGDSVCEAFVRACDRAGLDGTLYGAHSLRAGMVTTAIESGCPESLVMRTTGHKSLETLQRYVRPATVFSFNPLARAL